jgi:SAM-dependent methyltransferase
VVRAFNRLIVDINRHIAEGLPYQGTVVDLGCGETPYRDIIERHAERYVAIDWPISLHGVQQVDVLADISQSLPLRDGSVDTVVAFQVLEHLPEPGVFLKECRRVLRVGGWLFLVVPFQWHVHEAPHDYYRFTRHGLEHLLGRAGFARPDISETTGFWQTCALKFNYYTNEHFARRGTRWLWRPIWWLTQTISPRLDALWPKPGETASYVVRATVQPTSASS